MRNRRASEEAVVILKENEQFYKGNAALKYFQNSVMQIHSSGLCTVGEGGGL